jgi:hypothetical protein
MLKIALSMHLPFASSATPAAALPAAEAGTESVQQVKWASDESLRKLTYLFLESSSIAAVTCPPGQYVTGFKGAAFVGLPWLPGCVWDALMRPGFNREDILSRLAWAAAGSGYLTVSNPSSVYRIVNLIMTRSCSRKCTESR